MERATMGEEGDNGDMTSPSSRMVHLHLLNPDLHISDGSSSGDRQLAVVPSSTCTGNSRFGLPKGWTVRLALRADGSRVDKYYYEPDTKKMFRSIREVERYLNGEEYTSRRKSSKLDHQPRLTTEGFGSEKMIVSGGMLLRLKGNEFDQWQLAVVTTTPTATSPFILPDGWVVEMRPRKGQGCDKYYYEPGTGRKFRSLVAVEKYLQEEKGGIAPLPRMSEMGNCGQDYNPHKRKKMRASASDFVEPPNKINWVLKDSGGLAWSPFVGKTVVPDPVKKQWASSFMQLTSDKHCVAPDLK